jgi:hypothetical protein
MNVFMYVYTYTHTHTHTHTWVQAILNRCFVGDETSNVEIPLLKKGGVTSSEVSLKKKIAIQKST